MKIVLIILTTILTSFYYFPFYSILLPSTVNTKMLMGVVGLIILACRMAWKRNAKIDKSFIVLSVYAIIISLIVRLSMIYNNTPDDSYASYFMSMWVWLGGAYAICNIIRWVHGKVSLTLITNYLIAVCVAQCLMAILIDSMPSFKAVIDNYIIQGQEYLNDSRVKRLYGIGASLDTAGIRFSLVQVLLVHVLFKQAKTLSQWSVLAYVVAFCFILVVGNMMARTTTVGCIIALGYMLFMSFHNKGDYKDVWKCFLITIVVGVPFIVVKYNIDASFAHNVRFAFEGFFSIVESGKWQVGSNDQLKNMFILPDTLKTWLIGDGYFMNPVDVDPFYVGEITGGYYKGVDIGYLRFIYYFGIIGLFVFMMMMLKATSMCIRKYPEDRALFTILLLISFIVWIKVSTDCFLIFALFITMPEKSSWVDENNILHSRDI